MGIITSQSRFTETYPIPGITKIISSLKFLDSFETAALSFEVFRPRRVLAFPFAFVQVLPVVFFVFPISAKTRKLERKDGYSAKRVCLRSKRFFLVFFPE